MEQTTLSQDIFLDSLSGIMSLLKDNIICLRNIDNEFVSIRKTLLRLEDKIDSAQRLGSEPSERVPE